jgi:hypothetical protein
MGEEKLGAKSEVFLLRNKFRGNRHVSGAI